MPIDFHGDFRALTGHLPFAWQSRFFQSLESGVIPERCVIPTGLGKTSLLAVWLIAKARGLNVPTRLVYVVNRRTVVDQTTAEAESLRNRAKEIGIERLAISTLRGQYADNQEWCNDPSRPAIVCGTVDMIGSRLLFGGYRIGYRSRPLHAAFLGQDAWLIHDEAHLEPAFQRLLEVVAREQAREAQYSLLPWSPLRVTALSATARAESTSTSAESRVFKLDVAELQPPHSAAPDAPESVVWRRLSASKSLSLQSVEAEKDIVPQIIASLLEKRATGERLIAFVQSPDDVRRICDKLVAGKDSFSAEHVRPLTGTMRGHERDVFAKSDPVFARFKPGGMAMPGQSSVVLVCTSAGEVGVDISADHLVSDLSTFDSMAQRFGRVNRYGEYDSEIKVFYCDSFKDDARDEARKATLALLESLSSDASSIALSKLDDDQKLKAFAPEPRCLPVTDSLLDAWSLTSVRSKMPGRPDLAKFLHGIESYQPPTTQLAWREELDRLSFEDFGDDFYQELLADFPVHTREILVDQSERVFNELQKMAKRKPGSFVWLVSERNEVRRESLDRLVNLEAKGDLKKRLIQNLADQFVILPTSIGGLKDGILDGDSDAAVEDQSCGGEAPGRQRKLISIDDSAESIEGMRLVREIELDDDQTRWCWYVSVVGEAGRTASRAVYLDDHVRDVVDQARAIATRLNLPQRLFDAVILAAKLHDLGKRRQGFQRSLGNRCYPDQLLAKSGKRGVRFKEPFRHELASLIDASKSEELESLAPETQMLVLHLIAAHHGRARPHFAAIEAYDIESSEEEVATQVRATPYRFATLQRQYGRWGLAYLESLLRAADWAASGAPTRVVDAEEVTR